MLFNKGNQKTLMYNTILTFINNLTGQTEIAFSLFELNITIYNTFWAWLILFIVSIGFIIIWVKICLLPSREIHKLWHTNKAVLIRKK